MKTTTLLAAIGLMLVAGSARAQSRAASQQAADDCDN